MEPQKESFSAADYPAVELAYPIALSSYETFLKRLDALDGRVQTTQAFIVTVTLAIPAIAANKGLPFSSFWFWLALAAFALTNAFAFLARLQGTITLLHPQVLYDEYLSDTDWEFKKNLIYWAGQHVECNNQVLLLRARLLLWACLIFLVEVVALVVWVAAGRA
jgi:hypothetical protein